MAPTEPDLPLEGEYEYPIFWGWVALTSSFIILMMWRFNLVQGSRWRLSLSRLGHGRVFWFECFAFAAMVHTMTWQWLSWKHSEVENFENSETPLSWQSAMWAIAAIALATMANMPSKLDGYSEELTFYLKSNPLTCLANIMTTFWALTPADGYTFNDNLTNLAIQKFGNHGLMHLDNRPVRMILFVLGAVPQAIKLYACKGVGFTQLIATCYLLDFINDELVLLFARRKARHPRPNIHSSPNTHPGFLKHDWIWSTYVMNCLSAMALLTRIVYIDTFERNSVWAQVGIIGVCMVGCASYSLSICCLGPSQRIDYEVGFLLLTMAIAVYWNQVFLLLREGLLWLGLLCICAALFVILTILFTATIRGKAGGSAYAPRLAYLAFTVFNLVAYYMVVFDAAHTYKPGWTEWLG